MCVCVCVCVCVRVRVRVCVCVCVMLKVVVKLTKSQEQKEKAFLVFLMAHMGIDTKVRKSDMCATTYIKKISMKCLEFTGL